ncbi:maestro heat-like repeat-containing protein family member 2B [Gopherus evgoodei]|uniref:maestro heat-like repeat-containing protein family member 2B n=1 Tax=Gopherus evgoodei TaxID=1825980 RepID=UPI0011CF4232|nr:maestro heat-like repeat-containing protein family member 2B [Gopherus evgoodei]
MSSSTRPWPMTCSASRTTPTSRGWLPAGGAPHSSSGGRGGTRRQGPATRRRKRRCWTKTNWVQLRHMHIADISKKEVCWEEMGSVCQEGEEHRHALAHQPYEKSLKLSSEGAGEKRHQVRKGVYNEVISLLAHMDDQDKDKIALRIACIAETKLAIVVTVLLENLQQDEQNRVDIYYVLEKVLQQDTGGLERRLVNKIITLAFDQMRESQQVTNELKVAASNTLVTLARCYFNNVMVELHHHLEPPQLPEEFILVTLRNLLSAYALKCIPFMVLTLLFMCYMQKLVKGGRMRQAFCGVLEECSRAVNFYLSNWEKCSFPRMSASQFCYRFLPLYSHVTSNWLTCEEPELKQAIIKALGPMMSLLLHEEKYQDQIFELISWLLEQYKEDAHVFHITKSLSQLLEVSGEYKIPLPKRKFQAICSALHNQVFSQAKPLSLEHHTELVYCIVQLARSSPEDLIAFLRSQLKVENEAVRVASLNLLRAIVGADLPETRLKKFLIVKAVKSTLGDQNAMVRTAVLHFIRRLLSSESVENCAAWEMVAHVFREFSVSTSKLAIQEENTIQTLCIDILQCLDTSVSGMTEVLWPRLLEYVVPAQYTGTLKPLCRCLRELVEKKQQEGEEAACLAYGGPVKLPTPQGLLARLLVVASSPYAGEGHGCAALQLLQALHQNIHAAVGEMWVVKIPSLVQYIEGNTENSLDCARWEHMLLQFLGTSLEMIDDSAWSRQISLELSQQMASYTSPSPEKSFLYKALGTSLAVCQDLVHVKSQLHQFLRTTDYMEVPEREGVISILAFSAESHLDLTLNALQEFGAAMNKVKIPEFISRLKDYHHGKRGKTRSTLMLTYSSVAVHAPKDQLLSRVEADITGNILLHYRASCQVLGITVANKDMYLKLTLIHNVMEISCAILETRDSQEFEFSYKLELLGYMLDFIKKKKNHWIPWHLQFATSKLKPSLTLEENRELLDQCFKSLFPLPPLEMMKKESETAKDALLIQSLYVRSLEALGKLMETLLEEEPTADWFQEMFEVKKHKKFLLDILIGALHDIFSSEVIGESMKALAKVLKQLKEKDIGSSFRDLTQQIRTYFDDEDHALRSVDFVLFGILAQLTKKKWKAYFTEQVRKSWVTLLLHLQDPKPQVSMKCRATFHLCFPFFGLKRAHPRSLGPPSPPRAGQDGDRAGAGEGLRGGGLKVQQQGTPAPPDGELSTRGARPGWRTEGSGRREARVTVERRPQSRPASQARRVGGKPRIPGSWRGHGSGFSARLAGTMPSRGTAEPAGGCRAPLRALPSVASYACPPGRVGAEAAAGWGTPRGLRNRFPQPSARYLALSASLAARGRRRFKDLRGLSRPVGGTPATREPRGERKEGDRREGKDV